MQQRPLWVPDTDNYVALRALQAIEAAAKEWENLNPDLYPLKRNIFSNGDNVTNLDNNDDDGNGVEDVNVGTEVSIGIGDLSTRYGGFWADHGSHQNGLDMDVRYVRNDNKEASLDLQIDGSTHYDKDFTKKLIDVFLSGGASFIAVDPLADIAQSDKIWIDTRADKNGLRSHRHHFHVRFPLVNTPAGAINLTPTARSIPLGGSVTITSNQIKDRYDFQLIQGMQIRVTTDKGSINGQGNSVTLPVDSDGKFTFTLSTGDTVGTATINASSVQGDAVGRTTVDFVE